MKSQNFLSFLTNKRLNENKRDFHTYINHNRTERKGRAHKTLNRQKHCYALQSLLAKILVGLFLFEPP